MAACGANKPLEGVSTVNTTQSYGACALAGLGMIQVPELSVRAAVASGARVEVLPALRAQPMQVSLVVAHWRNLTVRVQAFGVWLAGVLAPLMLPL